MTGATLGPYRVLEKLGEGGMGEVYLAEDTRLRRKVALKVLSRASAGDEAARKRLVGEARAAAALDHPNICTVYEVGEVEGTSFIAMQYIDGETLADALRRGPLELAFALAVASQAGAALAEAHRRGIVHRDVKPQNIMLTAAGGVKVLDFGIARSTAPLAHDVNTVTLATDAGIITGTVPYMSPEQIRGDPLDARTDVFSLGCVMYESIAGRNPFLCPNPADTVSAVLTREPAPLPEPRVPSEVQRIVRKSLEKDRDRRYHTMRDLVIDLESVAHDRSRRPSRALRRGVVPAAAALLVVGAAAAAYLYVRSRSLPVISSADFVQVTALPDAATAPSLSPDGRMVAFIRGGWFLDSTGQIYVKLLPDGDPVQLTHDQRPKYGPTFTPDGTRVAYTAIDHVDSPSMSWDTWTVPVLGGEPTRLLPNAAGLTWIDARHVLFSEIERGSGLHMGIVTAGVDREGERRIYFPANTRAMAHYSYLSPDRKSVLAIEMDRTARFQPCRLLPFDGSSSGRFVGPSGPCRAAGWSPDGQWMYFTATVDGASHLWRQRFPDGVPQQITFGPATEEQGVAVAPDGRSLITSVGQSQGSLWVHDRGGDRLVPLNGSVSMPRMSADGRRVYCLVRRLGEPWPLGLTEVDLASGKADRILADFAIVDFDISRDEQSVAFSADDHGQREIWIAALDRRTPPRRVAASADHVRFGRPGELVYRSLTGTTNGLERVGIDGRGATRVSDRQIIDFGDVSPDGEWALVAASSRDDPSAGETVAVPVHGGTATRLCIGRCLIRWGPDGRSVYIGVLDAAGKPRLLPLRVRGDNVLPDVAAADALGSEGGVHAERHQPLPEWDGVAPGPDPSVYAFTTAEERGNLFRVPLR